MTEVAEVRLAVEVEIEHGKSSIKGGGSSAGILVNPRQR